LSAWNCCVMPAGAPIAEPSLRPKQATSMVLATVVVIDGVELLTCPPDALMGLVVSTLEYALIPPATREDETVKAYGPGSAAAVVRRGRARRAGVSRRVRARRARAAAHVGGAGIAVGRAGRAARLEGIGRAGGAGAGAALGDVTLPCHRAALGTRVPRRVRAGIGAAVALVQGAGVGVGGA